MPAPRLEIFEDVLASDEATLPTGDAPLIEEARLASYDSGYRAGWEDAVAAESEAQNRIHADLAQSMQALAFTYQEARMHILAGLEPLLTAIVEKLLPEMARDTLAPMVLDQIMPLAGEMADQPLHLLVNPVTRGAVEDLVTAATGLPIKITEEATLAEAQAYLRMGEVETKVDLTRLVEEISAAISAFFTLSPKAANHG